MQETQRERRRPLVTWRAAVVVVLWVASLAAAGFAGAVAYQRRADIRALLSDVPRGELIETNLYLLSVRTVPVPAQGRDGGIAALGDGIIFANRLGQVWFVKPDAPARALSLRIPINVDAFDADPFNANTDRREQFAVKDLMLYEQGEAVRIVASHNWWDEEKDCYALRISILETTLQRVLSETAGQGEEWRTVFDTDPCAPLTQNPDGVHRNPTNGAGGRLAPLSDHEVLLTVGGFGPDTPKTLENSYGKTILVNLDDGSSRIYSRGHRNPQGLAIGSDGSIWLTEHGDRGGDELNLIRDGVHYGTPFVTYGTAYGSMVWPNNPLQGHHEGYEKPFHAWVPSIGISQAMVVEKDRFPYWKGDILVTSLASRSMYRVRVEEGRVIFVEPIPIQHRIRDIAEAADGGIVLKTDDNLLLFLAPLGEGSDMAGLSPAIRGRVLAGTCMACHAVDPAGAPGVGPDLWRIMGRQVASQAGYPYSEGLRQVEGRWTQELMSRFLSSPSSVAPGTTMNLISSFDQSQVADLVAYLQTLQ